jgi:hypothetical protein
MVVLAIGLSAKLSPSSSSQLPCLQSSKLFLNVRPFLFFEKYIVLIVLAEQSVNTLSTAVVQVHTAYSQIGQNNASSNAPLQERDNPDRNFYQTSSWTQSLIYLLVAYATGATIEILALSGLGSTKLVAVLIPTPIITAYLPFYTILIVWVFIVSSMLLEDVRCMATNTSSSFMGVTRRSFLRSQKIFLFSSSLIGGFIGIVGELASFSSLGLLCVNVFVYLVISVMVYFVTM